MPDWDVQPPPHASWTQLEKCIERLHDAARSGLTARTFYRRLLAEAAAALGAAGGSAWRSVADQRLDLICQVADGTPSRDGSPSASLLNALRSVVDRGESSLQTALATGQPYDTLICPVRNPATPAESHPKIIAVFELQLPSDASSLSRQGWLDFASTIAEIATDFHALDELARLRDSANVYGHAFDVLRRVQLARDFSGAAFEVANEGRRLLGCDRLNVVVNRGGKWRLASTSGVARIKRNNDYTRRLERLADQPARWGEPVEYPETDASGELPPRLAAAMEDHVDHSHAREVVCAPIFLSPPSTSGEEASLRKRGRVAPTLVLIGETFGADADRAWRRQLLEFGDLCAPALVRAAALDRFPLRALLRWSDRLALLRQPLRLLRAALIIATIAAAGAALIYVPASFNVEAPATLRTVIERDVFATATGSIAELRVEHGQMVEQGEVLIVLSDPELALKRQQARGEIDAIRKRLDAMAVTRTDPRQRDSEADDRLPLSAEQLQLEEQLASLRVQEALLAQRHEALTIRSPISGQVLTHEVGTLLTDRPVERGQTLLTIADLSSGWQLIADVPQRDIGHVVRERNKQTDALDVSYRLVGDVRQEYFGKLKDVSVSAPLEPSGLENAAPPVEAVIAVEGEAPAAARPGMSAAVRIHCGQRPLGYVWFHDVAATLYRWFTF